MFDLRCLMFDCEKSNFEPQNIKHRQRKAAKKSPFSSGDHSAVAPPVPIPNTEVKRCSPDGSATIGCARVGRRQNKNPAGLIRSGVFAFRAPPARRSPAQGELTTPAE